MSRPVGEAVRQISQQRQRSLLENARALALISMANDSLVASFFDKYPYNFWRPETAIRAGGTDSDPKAEPDRDCSLHRETVFPQLSLQSRRRNQHRE